MFSVAYTDPCTRRTAFVEEAYYTHTDFKLTKREDKMERQNYNNHKQQYGSSFSIPISRMAQEREFHNRLSKAKSAPVETRLSAIRITDSINEGVPAAAEALEMWLEM
jgi:hypothetical protein